MCSGYYSSVVEEGDGGGGYNAENDSQTSTSSTAADDDAQPKYIDPYSLEGMPDEDGLDVLMHTSSAMDEILAPVLLQRVSAALEGEGAAKIARILCMKSFRSEIYTRLRVRLIERLIGEQGLIKDHRDGIRFRVPCSLGEILCSRVPSGEERERNEEALERLWLRGLGASQLLTLAGWSAISFFGAEVAKESKIC